jgi:glycerophosphoryl diester phosphodiesterase
MVDIPLEFGPEHPDLSRFVYRALNPLLTGFGRIFDVYRENSRYAFELAWRQGADGIEGDFRLTSDNQIVCIHDESARRVSGEDLAVAETAYSRLRTLDVGAWKGPGWTGQRIPTLPEVLATLPPRGKLFLEIKCGPEILPPLASALANADLATDQLILISFSAETVAEAKKRFPGHKALWIVEFEPAGKSGAGRISLTTILKTLSSVRADGLDAQAHPVVDAAFVEAIRKPGYELHLWSEDEVPRLVPFTGLQVDSITCNFPGSLRAMAAGSSRERRPA